MHTRFAAPSPVPGRTQQIGNVALPTTTASSIGKRTNVIPLDQKPYRHLKQSAGSATNQASAEIGQGDFGRLFGQDENGKLIVQYARIYALDIATQIINHYAETPDDFQPHFDVATDSIVIGSISGLPSANDEWKSRYGRLKIRIRVVGTFIELAKPQGFLVTMSIEGLFGADSKQTFKPVLNEIVGAVPLKKEEPSVAPPPNPDPPSVAPESANHAG